MLGEIGTLAWTRRTNGLLSRPERARYIAAAVREQARAAAPLLAFRLGRGARRQAAIDDEDLRIPDSQVARDAVLACGEVQPQSIIEHNYRSFIFARALGSLTGTGHDEELLFVATMFHDAGVLEPDRSAGGRCFTLKGAAMRSPTSRAPVRRPSAAPRRPRRSPSTSTPPYPWRAVPRLT